MPLLTDARTGLWQAIDNWPALSGKFKRTIRYDRDAPHLQEIDPALSEMPCLAIGSVGVKAEFVLNRTQHWLIAYEMEMWTPHWVMATAELLWEELMNAMYRSASGGAGTEYVRTATGYPVHAFSDLKMEPLASKGDSQIVKCIKTSWLITLKTSKDPFTS